MKNIFHKSFFLILIIFISSCESDRWSVEVEKIKLDLTVNRFEQALFTASENGLDGKEIDSLLVNYPQFFPLFTGGIMGFGQLANPKTKEMLRNFTANEDISSLYKDVNQQFPVGSLTQEFDALEDGFRHFHYYFPERIVPEVTTMISAFSYTTATDDSILAIGLDNYLGPDYKLYPTVGIPKYKFKNFSREYIVSDAMNAWLLTEFDTEGGQNLLEQMIFRGKIAYLTKAFLPKIDLAYIFNYDENDLNWCNENESGIWFHFVDMELLYAKETHQIRKYMGDAPFIAGFPEGSPGRVGNWVGYQIVDSFMENNKEVSLSDLMNMQDANRILRKSKYKPRR